MPSRWITAISLVAVLVTCNTAFANAEFKAWQKQQSEHFNTYLNKEQAAFKNALETDWKNFKLSQPSSIYSEPKVDIPPVAPEPSKDIVETLPDIKKTTLPSAKPKQPNKPVPKIPVDNSIEVSYLGKSYFLPPFSLKNQSLAIDNKAISKAWENLYPEMSDVAVKVSTNVDIANLPDWALVSLLNIYAEKVNDGNKNRQQLFLWALLLEMGFDARLAYDNHYLYLLLPSEQKIYGKLSINFSGTLYYSLTGNKPKNSLYTYTDTVAGKKTFNFSFRDLQPIQGLTAEVKTLKDDNSGVEVSYYIYPQLASYYRYHPALDFVWYFKVSPQNENYLAMVNSLKMSLSGESDISKVRVLLSLVQHGFEYQKDDHQWGDEYYSTPMHTLMLDAVDCEDRSFLFAFLVEQVVGLKTVGLKYPGHLAVAVAIPEKNVGQHADFVMVKDQKFYVADPTYIGADIGQTMPMFNGIEPRVINKNSAYP